MTLPRPVTPGRFIFITRRCTQRELLLRPDPETNNAFVYCLAEAAKRTDIDVITSQMMSNHHHTNCWDPNGRHVEFREQFHKMMAKSQNALRGRSENFWSSEEAYVIEVLTPEDLLEKLVYTATNPVKDGLVEKACHWPGPNFTSALLNGRKLRARRPRHFFRRTSTMPATVELECKLPDSFEGKAEFLAELRRRIREVETACAEERRRRGKNVLGRAAVLRQSWRSRPSAPASKPRKTIRRRIACSNTAMRIEAIRRMREWQIAYRHARGRWRTGRRAVFPAGTYWLARFANVKVEPPATG